MSNTLRPRQNGRHFANSIFKCISLNENIWVSIKIWLTFVPKGPINNIPALVQIIAWRRLGDKPLSDLMMAHPVYWRIYVTRPQWVNSLGPAFPCFPHRPSEAWCWCMKNHLFHHHSWAHYVMLEIKLCMYYHGKHFISPLKCLLVFIVRRAGLLLSQQDFEWRWSVPLFQCLTVLEFSFILFDLCLLITFFNFIMNYVPIVTFWIFTYHKIWILSIMFCFIWSYWIIYFLACL